MKRSHNCQLKISDFEIFLHIKEVAYLLVESVTPPLVHSFAEEELEYINEKAKKKNNITILLGARRAPG